MKFVSNISVSGEVDSNGFKINGLQNAGAYLLKADGTYVSATNFIQDLTAFVPYTGATNNIKLGAKVITTNGMTVGYSDGNWTGFDSGVPYSFLNNGQAQKVYTGGLLTSDQYSDQTKIPNYGIYSKGMISSGGGFKTENGTSTEYLKADGTVDGRTFMPMGVYTSATRQDVVYYADTLTNLPLGSYVTAMIGPTTEPTNRPGGIISFGGKDGKSTRILGPSTNEDNLWFQSGENDRTKWFQFASRDWVNQIISGGTFTPAAHTHPFSQITAKPTTLAGYGITDAVPTSRKLTINGTQLDLSQDRTWSINTTDTVTRLKGGSTGTFISGDITLAAGANTQISQTGQNITISSTDTNTTYSAGNGLTLSGTQFSLPVTVSGSGSFVQSITQNTNGITVTLGTPPNNNTTYTASNGISLSGTNFAPVYGTIAGTIAQGNDSRINNGETAFSWGDHSQQGYLKSYVNTVTRLKGGTAGALVSGDINLLAGANTTITQSGQNITINSTNTNTTYSAGDGLKLTGTTFSVPVNFTSWVFTPNPGSEVTVITNVTADSGGLTFEMATIRNSEIVPIKTISRNGTRINPVQENVDIPLFDNGGAGLVPARVGTTTTRYLREDGTWTTPTNTTYAAGTLLQLQTVSPVSTNYLWSPKVLVDWINGKNFLTSSYYSGGDAIKVDGNTISVNIKYDSAIFLDSPNNTNETNSLNVRRASNLEYGVVKIGEGLSHRDGYISVTPEGFVVSGRDYSNGYLIKTDLPILNNNGPAILLEIKGNTYDYATPLDCKVQLYYWQGNLINYSGYSTNPEFTYIRFKVIDGKYCFHIPNLGYWKGYSVKVTNVNSGAASVEKNCVTEILNESFPVLDPYNTVINLQQIVVGRGTTSQFIKGDGSLGNIADIGGGVSFGGTGTGNMAVRTSAGGLVYASGVTTDGTSVTASAFYESSLRKYKENIENFDASGLDLIKELDIVTFDRTDNGLKNKIGVIADDTPKEFLSETKNEVDLYKTIFIQAKAIQELEEKNRILEERLNKLEVLLNKVL